MDLYVETSVWNMRVDAEDVNRQKRAVTESFFRHAETGRHRLFISPLVVNEITADPNRVHRQTLEDEIARSPLRILEQTQEVLLLGRAYVENGIIAEKYEDDAVHIAYAVVNELDAIVSWNLRHIVKTRTRQGVLRYNQVKGLHMPDIATPEEAIEDVEDDG